MWNQSEKNEPMDNHVTDPKTQIDQQDSGIIDSGFISSGNLLLSSTELSGELMNSTNSVNIEEETVDGASSGCLDNIPLTVENMRTDSGLDLGLSESLSHLTLRQITLNSLGRSQKVQNEPILEPIITKSEEENTRATLSTTENYGQREPEPWEIYYVQDEEGDTQLHVAIIQGCFEVAAFSLIRMAPHPCLLDIINDDGEAPLHLAVLTRQPRIARRLILGGANPALRDSRGDTALHIACSMGDLGAARALTEPLALIERNYLGPHKRIPALPQDLEQRNYRGEMCLHVAAARDQVDVVRLLLRLGADLEAREGLSGKTALHLAIELGCRSVVQFLLGECRPCLDATTYAGITAYQIAIYLDTSIAHQLVSLGATPEPLPESDTDSNDDSCDEDEVYMSELSRLRQSQVGVRA